MSYTDVCSFVLNKIPQVLQRSLNNAFQRVAKDFPD